MRHPDFRTAAAATTMALGIFCAHAMAQNVTFKGGASLGFGELVHSSDTTSFHYNNNRIENVGASFSMNASFGENLQVSTGLGILEKHYLSGSISDNGGRTPFIWVPYVVNANFRYAFWDAESDKLALTGGYFPYSYNPDVKDLGLYLLRGPVHPGIIIAGYDSKYTKPIANTMGLRVQHVSGGFEQNLILGSEVENFPLFDISPAYIAGYQFGKVFHIGGGVNFYHWLPIDKRLTSPDTLAYDGSDANAASRVRIHIDSVANGAGFTYDTTYMSFAGTKLMANASFDPKPFFGGDAMGPEDLKLYGEIALIGLENSKAYKAEYGDYMHRMPVMVGFNFPMFRMLDHLSLEVEWYGARFKDDLSRFQASTGNPQSALPVQNTGNLNLKRDDWKWALHAAKTIGQFQVSAQIANDHTRPGGTLTSPGSEWEAYTVTPKDWYWILRAGYFF